MKKAEYFTLLRAYPGPAWMVLIFIVALPIGNALGLVSDLTLNLLGRYLCFAIAALGIDLIWGFTGILSLCQAAFFAMGGYGLGMHMLLETGTEGVYGIAIPDFMVWNQVEKLPLFWQPFHNFPLAIILSIAVPGLFALIFGFLAFRSRIKGVYFSIITQALALALWLIFLRNETMLGGTNGLTDFKTLLGFDLSSQGTKKALYFVSATVLILAYIACRAVVGSKLGRLLIAIRDSENRVRFTGYSVTNFKVFVFVFAAVLGAIGGMLYVPQTGIITPGRMDVRSSIEMVIWVAVGGRGTLVGAVVGALGVNLCYSYLTARFPGTWLYFLGSLFIGVVLFFPQGITGVVRKVFPRKKSPLDGKEEATHEGVTAIR